MENKPTVMAEYDSKYGLYQNFTLEVKHQLQKILEAAGIICNAITSRVKDRDSLSKKIDRKDDKYTALCDLTDIAGVRVITYYTDDVDKVAEIVEQEFVVDKENSIDKRAVLEPDRFGYCSVHYVVEMSPKRLRLPEYQMFKGLKCELQIRSVLQHAWAEIEHDLGYKSEVAIPKGVRRNFSRLAGLLEIADKEFQEIRSFLQSYQSEATEKIESEEFQDAEIDAVLLETIIATNPDIESLNEFIKNRFDRPLSQKIETASIEHMIRRLHWFDIYTVSQLNRFIEHNKDYAEIIAKEIIDAPVTKKDSISPIPKTVALFYICYAALLSRNPSYDQILQYFKDTRIRVAGREDFVQWLLELSKKQNRKS